MVSVSSPRWVQVPFFKCGSISQSFVFFLFIENTTNQQKSPCFFPTHISAVLRKCRGESKVDLYFKGAEVCSEFFRSGGEMWVLGWCRSVQWGWGAFQGWRCVEPKKTLGIIPVVSITPIDKPYKLAMNGKGTSRFLGDSENSFFCWWRIFFSTIREDMGE